MKDDIKNNILNTAKKNAKNIKYISEESFNNNKFDGSTYIKFNTNNTIEYTSNTNNTNNITEYKNNIYLKKELLLNVLEDKILPKLTIKNNFIININLYDITNKKGILTFGGKTNTDSILIPDISQMYNYKDSSFYDNIDFDKKINKIYFRGSSTGNLNIKFNSRVNTCIWGNTNKWAIKNTSLKLTNIVQMTNDKLLTYTKKYNTTIESIISNNVNIDEQLKYKYMLNIDGNTFTWNKPIWIMNSNSLFFKYESDNIGWYYDFLREDIHYVSVNTENMEKKYNFFENNNNQTLEIINNSKKFVKDYCSEEAWTFYFRSLLEEISYNV